MRLFISWAAILLMFACCAQAFYKYWPARPERYIAPTMLSAEIQKHAPWLYRPPAQVFAERFGSGAVNAAAVVGPDCRRIVIGDLSQLDKSGIAAIRAHACRSNLDLPALAKSLQSLDRSRQDWRYAKLPL